jgi:hypothetical protein
MPHDRICSLLLNSATIKANWPKLVKIDRFSNFFGLFSRFLGRGTHRRRSYNEYSQKWDFLEKIEKINFGYFFANFSHILWSKNHVLKKVGRGRSHDLFSNWCFRNLHALGYQKKVTICLFIGFGSNTPSAWCAPTKLHLAPHSH